MWPFPFLWNVGSRRLCYLLYCPIVLAIHVYRRLLDRGIQGACMRFVRASHKASRQRSASRAGTEKQHYMQGLRMDKARPTSLPRRGVTLFGNAPWPISLPLAKSHIQSSSSQKRIVLRSSRRGYVVCRWKRRQFEMGALRCILSICVLRHWKWH